MVSRFCGAVSVIGIYHQLSRDVRLGVTPHALCRWCRDTFVAPLYELALLPLIRHHVEILRTTVRAAIVTASGDGQSEGFLVERCACSCRVRIIDKLLRYDWMGRLNYEQLHDSCPHATAAAVGPVCHRQGMLPTTVRVVKTENMVESGRLIA